MLKIEKGERNYLSTKKRKGIFYTLLFLVIGIIIFLIGYFLNKKSTANIFTILAVLMALPGAKMLTNVIVLMPFHDVSVEDEQKLLLLLPEHSELLSSVVFTSTEKVMNLDFIWVWDGYVYGCLGKKDQDLAYMQGYLSKGIHNYVDHYQVKLFEDQNAFKKAIKMATAKGCTKEEREQVMEYLLSLII